MIQDDLKKIVDALGTVEITVSAKDAHLQKIGRNWSLSVLGENIEEVIENTIAAIECRHENAIISMIEDRRFKRFDYTVKCPCGFCWDGSSKAKKRDETISKIGMTVWKQKKND